MLSKVNTYYISFYNQINHYLPIVQMETSYLLQHPKIMVTALRNNLQYLL